MKVLVISHNSFSTTHNNGKTLSAIFSCFNKDELCQLYFTPIGNFDLDRCDQYYLINIHNAVRSIIYRKRCGAEVNDFFENASLKRRNVVKRTFFSHILRDVLFLMSSWYDGGLRQWLKLQKPNVIFYVGGDAIFSQKIAVSLSHKLSAPLVTYYTDDYVINPPTDFYVKILRRFYNRTVYSSTMLFAIGEDMAKAYSAYFEKQFYPIMNMIDMIPVNMQKVSNKDYLKLGYFGGLHLGRDIEICRLATLIRERMSKYLSKKIIIDVYTFGVIRDSLLEEYRSLDVLIHNGITGDDLIKTMSLTDVFLHVESIEPQYKSLTMLSVSTKIPEYMGMGKPILAFGSSDVASFKVIARANDSLVIDDNNEIDESLLQTIADILNDEKKLSAIANDNYNYAKRNYDKKSIAMSFRGMLQSVNNISSSITIPNK